MPFILQKDRKGKSVTWILIAVLFASTCFLLPVKTVLYLAICAAFFGLLHLHYGKIDAAPVFISVLISPVFDSLCNVFTFPIRLQLTNIAVSIMKALQLNVSSRGNVIIQNGSEFSVDSECMGLNMLISSFVTGVVLVAIQLAKSGKRASYLLLSITIVFAFGLNLFANILRIIGLVHFQILPANPMHDLFGLGCFAVYVLMPLFFYSRFVSKRFGSGGKMETDISIHKKAISLFPWLSIILLLFVAGTKVKSTTMAATNFSGELPNVQGYSAQWFQKDVLKLETDAALIYAKRIPAFYFIEHNPLICWRGSGYEPGEIGMESINDLDLFTAVLFNGKDQLFTAWWYSDGESETINQFSWRFESFRTGNPCYLLNVTAADPISLRKAIADFRSNDDYAEVMKLQP